MESVRGVDGVRETDYGLVVRYCSFKIGLKLTWTGMLAVGGQQWGAGFHVLQGPRAKTSHEYVPLRHKQCHSVALVQSS